ncbi:uncharacterized protein LOC113857288 [Abrus precatorius]|uniref:Uncharacterized protein LOC113857288 n=1 Tax=Abrus precatorius TaxID=3816 RepID=A0A8B8KQE5_ABRPR|nr:uncharacterized protein LOC113857288 [Abrus precatorius]
MASNNGGKEERRRRIAERGSDRMALITGKINALPPTPPSAVSSPTYRQMPRHGQSLSVDANSDTTNHLPPRHLRPQSLSSAFTVPYQQYPSEDRPDAPAPFARLKHQGGFRYASLEHLDIKSDEEPLIQDSETVSEVNNQVSEGDDAKTKSPPAMVRADDAKAKPPPAMIRTKSEVHETHQLEKPSRHKATFFSSRELNSCIIASETTRALSSLIIALLVVFYYMISENVLASRPLYIVLLTDITIVLTRLYRGKASLLEETERERVEAHGDKQSWGDAVKLLERGLVVYQAIRGAFIDCSIYLVVVVCGTSLM